MDVRASGLETASEKGVAEDVPRRVDSAWRFLDAALGVAARVVLRAMRLSLRATGHVGIARVSRAGFVRDRVRAMLSGSQGGILARAMNDEIERQRREFSELLFLRGMTLLNKGDYPHARRDLAEATSTGFRTAGSYFYLGMACMQLGDVAAAEHAYRKALNYHKEWPQLFLNLAHVLLTAGNRDEALPLLRQAIGLDPSFAMAHQNIAAKYDRASYRLQPLDLEMRDECMLYDACNLAGEKAIHAGLGRRGVELFVEALRVQRNAARDRDLPADLIERLSSIPPFDPALPTRILPYEWVTQIGHIAMLDTYLKIGELGWRGRANAVLLAPPDKVANAAYLDCWRSRLVVVEDEDLVTRLFPWQRYFGDCFNAVLDADGAGHPFPEYGARVHVAWDDEGRPPLLALDDAAVRRGRERLEQLGLPRDAWFVTLHVREGGFHREQGTRSQAHRNASVLDYVPAIEAITQRGGWVVRMGDRSMQPMPALPGTIDYAHSAEKSPEMDVFLCGGARMFIGTTSGLTNAVISFGTPCVLVNCLSNFAQLWNTRVTFTLKPFWSEPAKRYLRLDEMLAEEFRSKVFDLRVLAAEGVTPENNTSEDIEAAVEEALDELIAGRPMQAAATERVAGVLGRVAPGQPLYGNARASNAFFARRADIFFGTAA